MKQHVDMETDEPKSRAMITEGINAMLKCLLSKDEMNCKKCKTCEKVDSCCFLMESVFVYQYHKKRKDNSAL
jgi:hypothetical protein